jgi:tetratricopeptide (TPR) repeat protein
VRRSDRFLFDSQIVFRIFQQHALFSLQIGKTPMSGDHDRRPVTIAFAAVIVLMVVRTAASLFPHLRLWGLNQGAFVTGLWIVFPFLALIAFYLYTRYGQMMSPRSDRQDRMAFSRRLFPYLAVVLSIVCFWLFSVKEYFLGDGQTLISSLADPNLGLKLRAYGEMLIHQAYMNLLGAADKAHALRSYQHLSILAGAVYVLTVVYYAGRLARSRFAYYAMVLLMLTLPATLLFFGYVENYSLVSAVLYLFFLSAVYAIRENRQHLTPIIAFVIALVLHSITVVYLPVAALYVVFTLARKKGGDWIARRAGLAAGATFALVVIVYVVVRLWGPLFWKFALLPPVADRFTLDHYTLFAGKHLLDYLNLLVFLLPVTMLTTVIRRVALPTGVNDAGHTRSQAAAVFAICGGVLSLTIAFLVEPKLGMARDWDLMSLLLIGAAAGGVLLWVTYFEKARYFRAVSLALIVLNLGSLFPWVVLHNSPQGLYDYNMAAMELDLKHCRAGFFTMRVYNEENGRQHEAERISTFCREQFPEMWIILEGYDLLETGEISKAEGVFDWALHHNPAFFVIYLDKALCRLQVNDPDGGLENLRIADALNPYNTYDATFSGLAYQQRGQIDQAKKWWVKSIAYDGGNPIPYLLLAVTYLEASRPDSALEYIRRYPGLVHIPRLQFRMGTQSLMLNDSTSVFDTIRFENQQLDPEAAQKLEYIRTDIRRPRP